MGEHRLGDKRAAPLDELLAGLRRDERSLVGVGRRVVGPAVFGDLIGVENTLPRSSGASVSSTKVDLPAPLGPATRSSRFTVWLGR